jgi:hypothetical protein
MPRGGARAGGGRKPGTKNKATIERELVAVQEMQQRSLAPIRALAKDQLGELVPVVKEIVTRFQMAAIASGAPGDPSYKPEFWKELRDWIKTYATIADLAADFESPRYRAIEMIVNGDNQAPFVVRAPAVMADSSAWQAAVGAAVIDMEATQSPGNVVPVAQTEREAALAHPNQTNAPAATAVPLMNDPKTNRITVMPPGPRVVQPSGTQEWLDSIKKVG